MPRFGFVGPSYRSQSLNTDAQMTMNWYPESTEGNNSNAPIVMLPTPGLKSFANLAPFGWGINWGGAAWGDGH